MRALLLASLVAIAFVPRPWLKPVCEWIIPNPTPEQAAKLAALKRNANCPGEQ